MQSQPASVALVEMRGIVKRFPGVLALDHVDFDLRPGEVHMLLGENGAGKSTLIKVLSGAYSKDEGEILVRGKPVAIHSPMTSTCSSSLSDGKRKAPGRPGASIKKGGGAYRLSEMEVF
jgi:ABC-type sugar transport system ATPase subunit